MKYNKYKCHSMRLYIFQTLGCMYKNNKKILLYFDDKYIFNNLICLLKIDKLLVSNFTTIGVPFQVPFPKRRHHF